MTQRVLLFVIVAIALEASPSWAQSRDPWWKLFEIRKSFDGGSAEQEPASAGLVDPGPDSTVYWLLDAGIRLKPQSTHLGNTDGGRHPPLLIWYPSVEWHHMSSEPLAKQEATNSGGVAANAEVWFGDPDSTSLKPYLLFQAALIEDVLNDTTTTTGSLLLALFQAPENAGINGGFRPGSPIKIGGYKRAQYFPYVGYEYLNKVAITSDDQTVAPKYIGGTLLAKVDFELTPFHHEKIPGNIRFTITGKYEYRRLFEASDAIGSRDANFLNLSFSYYFVSDRRIGLGLTLDNGSSPDVNFVTQHRTAIVLKAKL